MSVAALKMKAWLGGLLNFVQLWFRRHNLHVLNACIKDELSKQHQMNI